MVKPTYKKKITEKGKSKTHITSGNDESRNVTKEETEEFYKYFCNLPHHLSLVSIITHSFHEDLFFMNNNIFIF